VRATSWPTRAGPPATGSCGTTRRRPAATRTRSASRRTCGDTRAWAAAILPARGMRASAVPHAPSVTGSWCRAQPADRDRRATPTARSRTERGRRANRSARRRDPRDGTRGGPRVRGQAPSAPPAPLRRAPTPAAPGPGEQAGTRRPPRRGGRPQQDRIRGQTPGRADGHRTAPRPRGRAVAGFTSGSRVNHSSLCEPSQRGFLPVCLHPHIGYLPGSETSKRTGRMRVPRWEPSHQGCLLERPQEHHQ